MMISRRRWLASSGALLIGSAHAAAQDRPQANRKKRKRCTLGFSTYGMQTMSSALALRTLADIGFDAVELAVREGWDADSARLHSARRSELRALLNDTQLRLSSLMEHVYPSDDRRQAIALDRLKLAANVAHDLAPDDPPLVQTVLGGGNFESDKHALLNRLEKWIELADSTKTTIAIKPHRGGVVSKPSEAVWLIEQLGRPERLRMVYDYSHYAFRGLPLEQTIEQALPYTSHIAVKDAVKQAYKVAFQLPGEAQTIDFAKIIRRFHEGGYRGDINCEVSSMVSKQKGYDPVAAAKTCYRNLAKAFGQAGLQRS